MKQPIHKGIESEYSEGLKFVFILMIGVACGCFVMGKAITDGSIPSCTPEFYQSNDLSNGK